MSYEMTVENVAIEFGSYAGREGALRYQVEQLLALKEADDDKVARVYKPGSPDYIKFLADARYVTRKTRSGFADGDCSGDSHYLYEECEAFINAVNS